NSIWRWLKRRTWSTRESGTRGGPGRRSRSPGSAGPAGEDGAEGAVATAMTSIIVPQNHVQFRQFNVGSALACTDGPAPIRALGLMPPHANPRPAALTAATVFSAIPAVSQADVTFGSRLDHEPSNSAPAHNCREDGSDDPTPTCTRVAIDQSFAVSGG